MPDRILRASILPCERVEKLSWQAETFFRRLMSVADDFGCYDGRIAILRAHLFALRLNRVSEPDLGKWIRETEEADLVRCYTVEGRPYIEIQRFKQRLKDKTKRKFPEPPAFAGKIPDDPGTSGTIPPHSDCVLRIANAESVSVTEPQPPKAAEKPIEERIYEAYPRKVGRQDAIKAINRCMQVTSGQAILESTLAYAAAVARWPAGDEQFIPHPATWFNRGSFADDQKTWVRQPKPVNGHATRPAVNGDIYANQ